MTIGPVDVVIIEFPGNKFTGELAPLLRELLEAGTIRVIDLVVVTKDADGNVASLEVAGIDDSLVAEFAALDVRLNTGLIGEDDIEDAAAFLEPNSSTAMLVWENRWAAPFVAALERADARVVDRVTIPRDVVLEQLDAAGIPH
jgi:hypothetical protein